MSKPDINAVSIADTANVGHREFTVIDGGRDTNQLYADALKFSRASLGVVKVGTVIGGYEDALDVNNRCSNLTVIADTWIAGGSYVATIKGGSHAIEVHGLVAVHGNTVDVDLGNISDQSDDLTTQTSLCLWTGDGSPIKVRVWNAEHPQILNPLQRYVFVFPSGLPLWCRRALYRGYKLLKKVKVVP